MDALRWVFNLYDGMSGPAGQMEKSLRGVEKALDSLPGSIAVAQQGFELLVSGARALAGVVFDGGKFAVESLAFKESTLASFELMTGTRDAAKEMFDRAKSFGKLTPFETTDVIKSFKDLMMAGFSREEIPIVFQAVGDVAAGNNFDKSIMDRLTLVLGQIRGNGKITGGDFIQLTNAGLGRSPIYESIAAMMGVKSTDVSKLVEQGKVTADVAIAAVLDAIRARYSGGKELGQGMLGQATTLKGLFSTLASVPTDLFLDIDLEKSAGFRGLKKFVQMLTDALNPDGVGGSKLKALIEGVVNDVGSLLGQVSLDDLIGGFNLFVDLVKTGIEGVVAFKDGVMAVLGPTFEMLGMMEGGKGAAEGFRIVMAGLGVVLGGILNTVILAGVGLEKLFELFGQLADYISGGQLVEDFRAFGAALVDGLARGIQDSIDMPRKFIAMMANDAIATFKEVLGIQSPSTVFAELGAYTAQGFAQGLDGAGGRVDAAVGAMVSVPSTSGRGSAPVINLTVELDGAGKDAEELARRIAELLPTQLASAFEQMATEGGVG